MSNRKFIAEIDDSVNRLEAIISYRKDIQKNFERRDTVFRKEQEVIQARRDRLELDRSTADRVIAETKKRIDGLMASRALLSLDVSSTRICDMHPQEQAKLKLRRTLAVIAELEKELEGKV